MKKTKHITVIAAAVFLLTSCAQNTPTDDSPSAVINGLALPQEEIAAYSDPEVEPILNDGNFYFMGDTDACFFSVKDGYIQFFGTDENMQYYYYLTAANYYLIKRTEGLSPGSFEDYETFCQSKKNAFSEKAAYAMNTSILGTHVSYDPYYDSAGNGPGGLGFAYIYKNNFGSINSDRGGIDLIFTRVADNK